MTKKYFVLKEDTNCDNYPTLVRLKDYCNSSASSEPTSQQLATDLINQGYLKIESATNVIFTKIGV